MEIHKHCNVVHLLNARCAVPNSNARINNSHQGAGAVDALPSKNCPDSILSELLDHAISASRSSYNSRETQSEVTRRCSQVARHYRLQPLSLDPVLISLVDAVTCDIQGLSTAQRSDMNLAVAQTLHGDSDTRRRLERHWHSLGNDHAGQ